jgi:hypothetical protein
VQPSTTKKPKFTSYAAARPLWGIQTIPQLQPATQMQWPALLSQGVTTFLRSTTNLKVRSSHTAMTQRLSISYASHP